ncbi:MAG: hypothetical protein V3S04_05095, partial [Candidatus Omnitrophota bacterium]
MTPRERIKKILDFKRPDRIGMHDTFLDTTIDKWRIDGMPSDISTEDYFNFDFHVIGLQEALLRDSPPQKARDKFRIISFQEPFQQLCSVYTREDVLRKLAKYPKELKAGLINETYRVLHSLKKIPDLGASFDGAWIWGDMAYKDGLFFSPSWYKENLMPLHKKICQHLKSQNLSIFFHSDGNVRDLLPNLIDIGVKAIHPLEENGGVDMDSIM